MYVAALRAPLTPQLLGGEEAHPVEALAGYHLQFILVLSVERRDYVLTRQPRFQRFQACMSSSS